MVFTESGKSGLALMLAGSGSKPQFLGIGSGSGTASSTDKYLKQIYTKRVYDSGDIGTQKEISWTFNFDSIDMNGRTLREFGIFSDSATDTGSNTNAVIVNPVFDNAITSGTDWDYSGGQNANYSGGRWTGWATSGTNSFQLQYISGLSAGSLTSGDTSALTQKFDITKIRSILFDHHTFQTDNNFETRYFFGGSLLGSLFVGSNVDTIGSQFFEVNDYSGTDVFKVEFRGLNDADPSAGSHYTAVDNFIANRYIGDTLWNRESIKAVTFDGTNELSVELKFTVF